MVRIGGDSGGGAIAGIAGQEQCEQRAEGQRQQPLRAGGTGAVAVSCSVSARYVASKVVGAAFATKKASRI